MPVRAWAFLGTIVALFATGSDVSATPLRTTVGNLLADADALYAKAAEIVHDAPSTSSEADSVAASRGRDVLRFQDRFQDRASALNPPPSGTSNTVSDAIARLNQFSNFAYLAVTDALSCDREKARAELRIAHEILMHAHADYDGKLQSGWDPNLDVPDGGSSCG